MRTMIVAALGMACAPAPTVSVADVDDTVVSGQLTRDGATVIYEAWSDGPDRASLMLEVNGMRIDVDLDRKAETLVQDGHGDALQPADLAILLALRDAVGDADPMLMETSHGELLLRHADRLADAPAGLVVDTRTVSMDQVRFERSATCGDDGLTCLPGSSGTSTAWYTPDGGSCTSLPSHSYGSNVGCRGRCGAGCASWWWPDDDYTQDCFDHDTCVGQLNAGIFFWDDDCGDEFWDAEDDYLGTFFNACP